MFQSRLLSFFVAISIGLFLFLIFFLPDGWVGALKPKEVFPKRANYFLKWELTESEAVELAKWDLLILDMEVQEKSRDKIQIIRSLNPQIIILAYVTPQEIRQDAANSYSALRRELALSLPEQWYLKNPQGQKLTWWPGTYVLNVTPNAPLNSGERLNDFMARFAANRILSTGLWDGVFYDNAWDSITHFVGSNIDLNGDGAGDTNLDSAWVSGMKYMYNETRRLTNNRYLIMGNGTTRVYRNELNGHLLENFIPGAWTPTMQTYAYHHDGGPDPRVNVINANTGNNGGENNYRLMRFGFTSALLGDGYYSFDYGDQAHAQTWFFDEYSTDLGRAVNEPLPKNGGKSFSTDVWRRDFENGVAVVNSTALKQEMALGGEYEKIRGKQDPRVNDGSIVSETTVDGYDGLILLKTFSSLNDVLFTNGTFLRFFRPGGERVRNGFFAFEQSYKGNDQVARIDLDGNKKRDLVVISKNKILAWRDDGSTLMKVFPYTASFSGNLRAAIGDIDGDGWLDIAVAPTPGFGGPIKIYNRDGSEKINNFFPFGVKYTGGYSLAVVTNAQGIGQLIVGAGKGKEPLVQVYDHSYKLVKEWLAFEKTFRGGVNVAAGNIDTDLGNEIIAVPASGKKPLIRIFSSLGKEKYPSFQAYETLNAVGLDVRIVDVDFDGKNDIVGMGEGI